MNFYAMSEETYLDKKPFQDYMALVEKLIHESVRPLSIGDIHKMLGAKANRRMTGDALGHLTDTVQESSTILPVRYSKRTRVCKSLKDEFGTYFRTYKMETV